MEVVEGEGEGGIEDDTQASVLSSRLNDGFICSDRKYKRSNRLFRKILSLRCLWDIQGEMTLVWNA